MTPERWARIQSVFQAALDCAPGERSVLLEQQCAGDAELRREVEELIAADKQARDFLDAAVGSRPVAEEEAPAARVGPYRILNRIGEGGMSTVYAAVREDEAYEKRVAVKFFRPLLHRPELVQRFRVERQILASLDHPHIAKLLDGGSTPEGVPFLVMDHVDGLAIDEYCDRRRLPIAARLELFRKVCSAVQYAHANLVVHRDIKPSNILVRSDGEPKLLDFGIAKLLNPELAPLRLEPTRADAYVMTPEYASPEQVRGEPVTTATDVYSLGVLLYRLLTGSLPHPTRDRALPDMLRAVCEEEPPRPSMRAMSAEPKVAEARAASAKGLRRQLAGDLDNIALKALRKEPQRRYASVEQLSEDVGRHLEGRPVAARRDTFAYRAGKFVRRHRVGVALALLAAALVIASAVTTAVQSGRLRSALAQAEAVTRFLRDTLGSANPYGGVGRDATVVEVLERTVQRIDASFGGQPEIDATVRAIIGTTYRDLGRYDEARPLLERALETRRRVLADSDPAIAESLLDLGMLLTEKEDFAKAEELYREALARLERAHGHESLETARALYALGNLFRHKWRLDEAKPFAEEALAVRRRRGLSFPLDLSRSLAQVADIHRTKGEYATAEPLQREAVALLERGPYQRTPEMGIALAGLAALLSDTGDLAAAEAHYRRAVALRQELLGTEHTAVADCMGNLAQVLVDREDFDEAERVAREALRIFEKVLGDDNLGVADMSNNLGRVLTRRPREAEAHFRRALAIHRKHRGDEHVDIAWDLDNLAVALYEMRRLGEAETSLRRSLAIKRKLMGPAHPGTLQTQTNLGEVLRESGDLGGALELLQEAAGLFPQTPAADPAFFALCRSYLGAVLMDLRRFEEAGAELLAAYAALEKASGRENQQTRETATRLERLAKLWPDAAFRARVRDLLGR